jgi:hypothetical protein
MKTLQNNDGTSLAIPEHVKTIDVHNVGNLIEIVSINPYMAWSANTTASVMELKCYAKTQLGFRQTTPDKWRWSR